MRTWKCRWPGSTPRRWASSRFVSCQSDSSSPPSISSTRTRSGWPSALSCSGLSMTSVSCTLPPWAVLHIETQVSSLDRGCCSAIEDCNGPAGGGADEARRRLDGRLFGERAAHRVCLGVAADDEEDLVRATEHGQRQRDAVDPRLEPRVRPDDVSARLVERGLAREEGRDVAVRADAEQEQVEGRVAQLLLVRVGGGVLP